MIPTLPDPLAVGNYQFWVTASQYIDNHINKYYVETAMYIKNIILNMNDPWFWVYFCSMVRSDIDTSDLKSKILQTHSNHYIIALAAFDKTIDLNIIEDYLLKQRPHNVNISAIFNYINRVPMGDIDKFIKYCIEYKSARLACFLLKSKKINKDSPAFQDIKSIIIKSKKSRYLYELAKHIPPEENEAIQQMVMLNKSDMYVRLYATNIPEADVHKLERRIIETDDLKKIETFADKVPRSNLKRLKSLF